MHLQSPQKSCLKTDNIYLQDVSNILSCENNIYLFLLILLFSEYPVLSMPVFKNCATHYYNLAYTLHMLCAVEVLTTESIFTLCFCAPHTPQLAFLMHQPQMLSSFCSLVANSRSPQLLSLENFSCSKQDLSIFKNSALVQCVTGCYNWFSVFWINPIQYTTYLGNLLHISKFLSKSTYLHIYISTYLQEVVNSSHQRAGVNLSISESPSKDLDFNSQKPSSFYSKRSTFWTNKQKVFHLALWD